MSKKYIFITGGASGMGRTSTGGVTANANPRIVCSICYETA